MAAPERLTLAYHVTEPTPRDVALEDVYTDVVVASPSTRPAVAVNMVQTLDGAVAINGRAWQIGSHVDHYLFRTLRGWADAVLSGAGTLRQNDVVATTHPHLQARRRAEGRSANPLGIVMSRRADFPEEVLKKRFFTRSDSPSVVLTTELARDEDRRRIEAAGAQVWVVPVGASEEIDVAAALAMLADRGITRVLAEGGPATNRRLADAGAIDEVFLTISARIGGVPNPERIKAGILGGARAGVTVISEYQYRAPALQEWYLRLRVVPWEPANP